MQRPILRSNKSQSEFDENGFTVVPLLGNEEVEQLLQVYARFFEGREVSSFTSTNIINSKTWRVEIAEAINRVIAPRLAEVFVDTKLWNPAFLIKPVGENTEFKLHQDWTFVDEDKYYSGNIWIPLCDTTVANGTICAIPKTHYKHLKTLRSQTIHEIFRGRENVIKSLSVPLNLKKGEAILFQHSLIHYSPSNTSQQARIAVSCGFNSKDAELLTYYKTGDNKVSLYSMPDNFVFEYDNVSDLNLEPNGTLIGPVNYQPAEHLNDEELFALISGR